MAFIAKLALTVQAVCSLFFSLLCLPISDLIFVRSMQNICEGRRKLPCSYGVNQLHFKIIKAVKNDRKEIQQQRVRLLLVLAIKRINILVGYQAILLTPYTTRTVFNFTQFDSGSRWLYLLKINQHFFTTKKCIELNCNEKKKEK